ncbi:hypothetical protein KUV50_14905 [Membranicola marinus]|uniref:HEPN AbiU2-like domain-containing protein n=1 Tax=Membranihabitans marinus TaxID=1227546 RepID=A0A953HR84_9BACT|nr:hypothetical protein [Membranihabitans marinus]MBY5959438.1 hypothetical protein [Membranihabitans marinus]
MSFKTANEIKAKMVNKLGQEFGTLFYSLHNEIIRLTYQWLEFKELYGVKESRILLMNEAAPFFFYTIQRVLWNHLLIGVTRITDPKKSVGKRNITLRAVEDFIEDKSFQSEFASAIKELCEASKFCRDWRNKKIVHIDYDLSMKKPGVKPLEKATREKFGIVIEKIQSLYNKVHQEYFDSSIAFYLMNSSPGAKAMLHRIEDGMEYEKIVHKRKLEGDWDWNESKDSKV